VGLLAPLVPGARIPGRVRLVFWLLFLLGAVLVFRRHWVPGLLLRQPAVISWRIERDIRLVADKDPKTAAAAWYRLYGLYNTSWPAYYRILERVREPAPIHLRFIRTPGPQSQAPGRLIDMWWPAPQGAAGEPAACRTVGEAVMAIAYDEGNWGQDHAGDWGAWWQANKHRYVAPPEVERR
jgi:hypothetical protein